MVTIRSSAAQAVLERMVTGERCEVKGCYENAIWLVSLNDDAFHWCPRHTKMRMRDASRWGNVVRSRLIEY